MYCHNCGNKAFGNFCSTCGTKLGDVEKSSESTDQHDWTVEKDYEKLISYSEVRSLIAKNAKESPHNLSAKEFLGLADLAFKPITGLSLKNLSDVIMPFYQKSGIKTGKSATKTFSFPTSEVIVKTLCSLAKNGYPLDSIEKATNGLVLIAKINSDMWTWGGDILISIENLGPKTKIAIDAKIKGQLYDWGKSKAVIEKIIRDIDELTLEH